jgi:hypothetical protein
MTCSLHFWFDMAVDASQLEDAPNPRRTRFSLRALFYLMTISVLAMGLLRSNRNLSHVRSELANANLEVRRWRREAGGLEIRDPKLFHAIAVPNEAEDFWKWRIWIPESTRYRVRLALNDIPENGVAKSADCTTMFDQPGEQIIRVWLQRDRTSDVGTLRLTLEAEGQGGGGGCSAGTIPLAEWGNQISALRGIGEQTRHYENRTSLVLFRCRLASSPSAASLNELAPGFMVWVEQVP